LAAPSVFWAKEKSKEAEYGAMTKKKKGKKTEKKTGSRKRKEEERAQSRRGTKEHCHPGEVGGRRDGRGSDWRREKGTTGDGEVPVRDSKDFPEATDGTQASADEECLAATLLRRLDLPDEPVMRDEEDLPKTTSSGEKPAARAENEIEEKEPGSGAGSCEENKEPVLA
jgi:hypothetical protein